MRKVATVLIICVTVVVIVSALVVSFAFVSFKTGFDWGYRYVTEQIDNNQFDDNVDAKLQTESEMLESEIERIREHLNNQSRTNN